MYNLLPFWPNRISVALNYQNLISQLRRHFCKKNRLTEKRYCFIVSLNVQVVFYPLRLVYNIHCGVYHPSQKAHVLSFNQIDRKALLHIAQITLQMHCKEFCLVRQFLNYFDLSYRQPLCAHHPSLKTYVLTFGTLFEK